MKYEPYFYINKVGIHHKTWNENNKTMYFFSEDLKLQVSIQDCEKNYTWKKCEELFGD